MQYCSIYRTYDYIKRTYVRFVVLMYQILQYFIRCILEHSENNNKTCGPQSRKGVQWNINRKKIQHVSLKMLNLLELLHKNGMVNRGSSLKAPQ